VPEHKRVLFIDGGNPSHNFATALRNVPGAKALAQLGANVRDIVLAERLFVTPEALAAITKRITRDT
jgi:ribosomal protein L4